MLELLNLALRIVLQATITLEIVHSTFICPMRLATNVLVAPLLTAVRRYRMVLWMRVRAIHQRHAADTIVTTGTILLSFTR